MSKVTREAIGMCKLYWYMSIYTRPLWCKKLEICTCSIDTRGFSIDTQGVVSIPGMFVSIKALAVAKVMIFGERY